MSIAESIRKAALAGPRGYRRVGVVEGHILNIAFCGLNDPLEGADDDHLRTYMLIVAEALDESEAQIVCHQAYCIVGSMLNDLGQFGTPRAEKVLDNLSQAALVHDDVLPWPSFAKRGSAIRRDAE